MAATFRTEIAATFRTEIARQELKDQGWTIVGDDASFRATVTKDFTGQYVSYFDPGLRAILIVLHSRLREALGI
jgi:hypothetical protein